MLSLFLFLAAAVPVLGDAQINRQTDAAAKRYRDRQGNRNKIIVEESVPSCPWSSGTFERSQLDMELSKGTELFGHPGGQYRIPVLISNRGSSPQHLTLSHQEAFPVQQDLHSSGTHVELVAGIQPSNVEVEVEFSTTVHVVVTVSDYVPPFHRSKVTVSARPLLSNQTEDDHIPHHADISFYFTVVKPDTVLADYDLTPPTCSLVCMDNCTVGDCQGWSAKVRLHDGSTGLGSSRLLWPRYRDQEDVVEVQREGGWPLGTNQASLLTIWAACCQKGVLLEQSDLAGHKVLCSFGEVVNKAAPGTSICLLLYLLCSVISATAYQ